MEKYDIYYSTGGGSVIGGGADVWVNDWIENIAPHLDTKPILAIHRTRPPEFKDDLGIEVVWQGDDVKGFGELLNNARRINILHGYYSPHRYITDNFDKIHTAGIHCNVEQAIKATLVLDLEKSFHFHMEQAWEDTIVEKAKYPFWIGIDKPKLKNNYDHLLHIPNFYEFKHNKDVVDNNIVGFAARMETRKCPHFLQGIKSELTTDPKDVLWWKRNLNIDTTDWKIYKFNYEFLGKFYNRDWGISHSAHIFEPFGYGIFQAIDYGKLPILAQDWLTEYDYPFRAQSPEEFKKQYETICKLSTKERQDYLVPLRDYLRKFDNKKQWRDKLLKLYNE